MFIKYITPIIQTNDEKKENPGVDSSSSNNNDCDTNNCVFNYNYFNDQIIEEEEISDENEDNDDSFQIKRIFFDNWKKSKSKLNEDDSDEDIEDKLYIISIDNIPHYYENNLENARKKMWEIANLLVKTSSHDFDTTDYYIFTNSLDSIKIIAPYNFLLLKYHHVLFEFRIDYVLNAKHSII